MAGNPSPPNEGPKDPREMVGRNPTGFLRKSSARSRRTAARQNKDKGENK